MAVKHVLIKQEKIVNILTYSCLYYALGVDNHLLHTQMQNTFTFNKISTTQFPLKTSMHKSQKYQIVKIPF